MLSPEKLTFGGYALLIALPAVVLAGLGAASLREDRLATSLEMREEGAQLGSVRKWFTEANHR